MATEALTINAIDATWASATGVATDIDEAVSAADTTYYGAGPEADAADFGFTTPGTVVDGDTVSQIQFTLVLRDDGTAGTTSALIDLLIGGSVVGTGATITTSGSDATYSLITGTSWTTDYTVAQLTAMQVRITPTQSGKPGTNALFIDCGEAIITYTSPPDFDQVAFRFYEDSAVGADSLTGMAAENTNATLLDPSVDTYFHLRDQYEDNGIATSNYDTETWYSKNGGAYAICGTATSSIQTANAGAACTTSDGDKILTKVLTTSARTLAQADYEEGNGLLSIAGAATRCYERHQALKIIAADVVATDYFEFRIYRTIEGAFGTYTKTGRLTLTADAPTGNGSLDSADSTSAGSGISSSSGDGSLDSSVSTLAASGTSSSLGDGSLDSAVSTLASSGLIKLVGSGDLAASDSSVSAEGVSSSLGDGSLDSEVSTIVSEGVSKSLGNGSLDSAVSTLAGSGGIDLVVSGRVMSSLVGSGGLAGIGGIAGQGGGLAG